MATSIDFTALPKLTNDMFYPLYNNKSRYLVLMGGGGSGKSVFAAQKTILRMVAEQGHKILVVRKVAKTLRDSVFAELRNIISTWGLSTLFKVHKSDLRITCVNGNEILFAGLDDVEKLKSIHGITSIWIEEASEIDAEDFRQLDIRLRGRTVNYKQIIFSFNPVSVTHWLKSEFFDKQRDGATTLRTTYKDNKFLDDAAIKVLEGFRESDPYYYMVYCLGEWGVVGSTVFNAETVTMRLVDIRNRKPLAKGTFTYTYEGEKIIDKSIRFVSDDNGPLTIYEQPMQGYPYVIGGDIAEGGIDYSVGQVRNNITWNQAAVWRGHTDTDLYAKQMYCLGRYYNDAIIGIETNFDTHPIKELQRLGYVRQYVREYIDKISHKREEKFGFNTTKLSRPLIISKYVALAREHIDTFNDVATLEEMLTFVRDENGKPTAQQGKHDDTILADAIALEVRDQQTTKIKLPEPEKTPIQTDKERLAKRQRRTRRRLA